MRTYALLNPANQHRFFIREEQPGEGQSGGDEYRVLMHPAQFPLIQQLLVEKHNVQVCSLHNEQADQWNQQSELNIDTIMNYLQQMDKGASPPTPAQGGWRSLGSESAVLTLSAVKTEVLTDGRIMVPVLINHPFYVGGGMYPFQAGFSNHLGMLLLAIYDIRRFRSVRGFYQWSGLNRISNLRQAHAAWKAKLPLKDLSQQVCSSLVVFLCWSAYWFAIQERFPDQDPCSLPGAAFMRYRRALNTGSGLTEDQLRRDLKVGQRFLQFVYTAWRAGVGDAALADVAAVLPEQADRDEFLLYIKNRDKPLDKPRIRR